MDNTLKTVFSRNFFYTDNNYEKHTLANNLKEISFDILKDMGFDVKKRPNLFIDTINAIGTSNYRGQVITMYDRIFSLEDSPLQSLSDIIAIAHECGHFAMQEFNVFFDKPQNEQVALHFSGTNFKDTITEITQNSETLEDNKLNEKILIKYLLGLYELQPHELQASALSFQITDKMLDKAQEFTGKTVNSFLKKQVKKMKKHYLDNLVKTKELLNNENITLGIQNEFKSSVRRILNKFNASSLDELLNIFKDMDELTYFFSCKDYCPVSILINNLILNPNENDWNKIFNFLLNCKMENLKNRLVPIMVALTPHNLTQEENTQFQFFLDTHPWLNYPYKPFMEERKKMQDYIIEKLKQPIKEQI